MPDGQDYKECPVGRRRLNISLTVTVRSLSANTGLGEKARYHNLVIGLRLQSIIVNIHPYWSHQNLLNVSISICRGNLQLQTKGSSHGGHCQRGNHDWIGEGGVSKKWCRWTGCHFIILRCEWIKSEKFQKKMKEDAKRREQNNPMKVCVLKYDHFENIHRLDAKLPSYEGAPNFRQVPWGDMIIIMTMWSF